MKTHRRFGLLILTLSILAPQWIADTAPAAQRETNSSTAPKYIFFFLADGAGISHMEITRQYNRVVHNEGLIIADKIMKEGNLGLITTDAADSLSTDSAAAATALASGCKAKLGVLDMCADGRFRKPPWRSPKKMGCASVS